MSREWRRQTRWASPPLPAPADVPPGGVYARALLWAICPRCDLQVHGVASAGELQCPDCGEVLPTQGAPGATVEREWKVLVDELFGSSPPAQDPLPAGLSAFGLTYHCGLTWSGTPRACPTPLDAVGLIDLAAAHRLGSVEFPARMLSDPSPGGLRRVREAADRHDLAIVVAAGQAERHHLIEQLELAHRLGAPVVRFTLSGILCGDRRGFPGGWPAHLERRAGEIEAALPTAERYGIALAAENHQDATSDDLLALCRRFESPCFGVTLDAGNPLAVMEEPLAFARRIAPYLKNVHLKDYRIHPAENGARLVRCALGEGVIDIPALLALIEARDRPIPRCVELAALQARLIPFLERSWWDEYPARDARDPLPALAVYWNHARPREEEWRTPLEREEEGESLAAYERQQLEASVAYLERLGGTACNS